MQSHQISVHELHSLIESKTPFLLLDVRNLDERQVFNLGGTFIPLSELPARVNEIAHDLPIVVYCHSGYRSGVAVEFLQSHGYDAKNLVGGVVAWQHAGFAA